MQFFVASDNRVCTSDPLVSVVRMYMQVFISIYSSKFFLYSNITFAVEKSRFFHYYFPHTGVHIIRSSYTLSTIVLLLSIIMLFKNDNGTFFK